MIKPRHAAHTLRWGLCCIFREEPIKFRNTTVKAMTRLQRAEGLQKLATLCQANAAALAAALSYCAAHGIGCFRINSQILPLKTHEEWGYAMADLPDGEAIVQQFRACGAFAQQHQIRTCFHPDQFVVLNSPRPEVVERSIAELDYQAEVAEWVGADVLNIHGGGAYGDKSLALEILAAALERLPARVRQRLTVENDDRIFTPADLLPFCKSSGVPLVYDVHHHRCNHDGMSELEATEAAVATWDREPLFHLSSPLEGWDGPRPQRHHDYINVHDFPACWRGRQLTIEVEAKAKELAVNQLIEQMRA